MTNPRVRSFYGKLIYTILKRSGYNARFEEVQDSEMAKSYSEAGRLLQRIASSSKTRPFLIALGGGVVGDLTGYVASILERGIPYIQVPTTLLAQVDSAIGGKTGIDLPIAKNLVGTIYQPSLVYTNLATLDTLNLRQLRDGLAEVIKYGIIHDRDLFKYLEKNYDRILRRDRAALFHIVETSSRIKAMFIEADEAEERGFRTLLNLGHTIGHAIEAASEYSGIYTHGESIGIGILCACELSVRLGEMSKSNLYRIELLIQNMGLPTRICHLKLSSILKAQSYDKKFIHGRPKFVIPIRVGYARAVEDIPLQTIKDTILHRMDY